MKEIHEIELKYFKIIWIKYQWFLLYEFKITDIDFFKLTDNEILNYLIDSRILRNELFHHEMEGKEVEVDTKNIFRPYYFKKIELSDFQFIKSKPDFEKWIIKFGNEGWEDDRDDAQILINQVEKELWSLTNLENGVWHLTKGSFENDSDKLIDTHWIYTYFETFIEIDRQNKMIRTFDFTYD